MQLFLDSSSPREIEEAMSYGMLDGVTTNPALIAAGGPDKIKTIDNVLATFPGPVFTQVFGWHDPEPMVKQARWLHRHSERLTVKLPMSIAGLQALKTLKDSDPTIRISTTGVASVSQAYLSAKAGADVVSIFNGPFDLASDTPIELVEPVRKIFTNYNFPTKILSCGRFPRHFASFAIAGSDICTMKLEYFKLLFEHPYTDQRMTGFLGSWRKVFGEETWPQE